MSFSQEVINSVVDGDLHVTLEDVEYSTSSRSILTVGDLENNHVKED